MDLSTTKKIKRRVFQVDPDKSQELTDCIITGSNFFEYKNLEDMKYRISSFYMNNRTIASMLPKYLDSLYGDSYINNLAPTEAVSFTPSTFTPTILDYVINIHDNNTNTNTAVYLEMTDAFSTHMDKKPNVHYSNSFDQYTNPYFYIYDTTLFCDMVANAINVITQNTSGLIGACKIVKTNGNYVLYMDVQFSTLGYELQFSDSLIELFSFKNVKSMNSTNLYTVIFNDQTKVYNAVVSNVVFSKYISDVWNAYDLLIFKTNLQLEKQSVYDSKSYIAKGYENVLLTFKIGQIPYNYFSSNFEADENWCSTINSNVSENMYIKCYLRIRQTNDLVFYTIKNREKFYITTEEIETY